MEAARAGDAGRGFAVVAEEVRALAMRSKEAAAKTEELLRQAVQQATDGEATSRQVSDKLGDIAQLVGRTSDIVAEIAAAVREQASGIEQVSKAVQDIGNVTQANAASSEETSSSATELSGEAAALASLVGSFQLDRARARAASREPLPGAHVAATAGGGARVQRI